MLNKAILPVNNVAAGFEKNLRALGLRTVAMHDCPVKGKRIEVSWDNYDWKVDWYVDGILALAHNSVPRVMYADPNARDYTLDDTRETVFLKRFHFDPADLRTQGHCFFTDRRVPLFCTTSVAGLSFINHTYTLDTWRTESAVIKDELLHLPLLCSAKKEFYRLFPLADHSLSHWDVPFKKKIEQFRCFLNDTQIELNQAVCDMRKNPPGMRQGPANVRHRLPRDRSPC